MSHEAPLADEAHLRVVASAHGMLAIHEKMYAVALVAAILAARPAHGAARHRRRW